MKELSINEVKNIYGGTCECYCIFSNGRETHVGTSRDPDRCRIICDHQYTSYRRPDCRE